MTFDGRLTLKQDDLTWKKISMDDDFIERFRVSVLPYTAIAVIFLIRLSLSLIFLEFWLVSAEFIIKHREGFKKEIIIMENSIKVVGWGWHRTDFPLSILLRQ